MTDHGNASESADPTLWTIHGERVLHEDRHVRLTMASVELPDGVRFEQYVARTPRAAMTAVIDDEGRVLLIRRHRWVLDQWVWELPGGYDLDADGPAAAAREVLEETGWRPLAEPELVLTYQPNPGSADSPQDLYLVRGAEQTDSAWDVNETAEIGWFTPLEMLAMTRDGRLVGSGTIMAALHLLAAQ